VEGGWGENIFSKDRNFLPWVQFNPPWRQPHQIIDGNPKRKQTW